MEEEKVERINNFLTSFITDNPATRPRILLIAGRTCNWNRQSGMTYPAHRRPPRDISVGRISRRWRFSLLLLRISWSLVEGQLLFASRVHFHLCRTIINLCWGIFLFILAFSKLWENWWFMPTRWVHSLCERSIHQFCTFQECRIDRFKRSQVIYD